MKQTCYKIRFWLIGLRVKLTKYINTKREIRRVFQQIARSYYDRGYYGAFRAKSDANIAEKILNEMGVSFKKKFDGVFTIFEVNNYD